MKYIFFNIISSSLFRNKRFVLNDMFQWNTTKFWNVSLEHFREYNYLWKVCYDLQKSWTFSIKKDVHRISYMVINKTYEIAQSILLSIKREGESGKAAAVFGFFFLDIMKDWLNTWSISSLHWRVEWSERTKKLLKSFGIFGDGNKALIKKL